MSLHETKNIVRTLGDLPNSRGDQHRPWFQEQAPSRFAHEGALESFINWVKQLASKPGVGVPRPSIADQFSHKNVEDGREDDIDEKWRKVVHPERIAPGMRWHRA